MSKIYKSILKNYSKENFSQKSGIRCAIHHPIQKYPVHRHDFIEFEYIIKGKMEHELNGCKTVMGPGSCYALRPGDIHSFTALEPPEIYHISISYAQAPKIIRDLTDSMIFPFTGTIPTETGEMLNTYFTNLRDCIMHPVPNDNEIVIAYTILILTTMQSNSAPLPCSSFSAGYSSVEKAMKYIEHNFNNPLTLEEVAEQVHLSPNYFCNLFKKISGTTFLKYLNIQRIENAKAMLVNTNKSILDIAFECGFGSFSAFSRTFRSICNTSPKEYRNK